jgi:DNA-binding CsgD family transcriptional regulator
VGANNNDKGINVGGTRQLIQGDNLMSNPFVKSFLYASPREKLLLRRFAGGLTDNQIATELGDKASRIAVQRQRLAEKYDIRTPEQLSAVANELAHHPRWKPQRPRSSHHERRKESRENTSPDPE